MEERLEASTSLLDSFRIQKRVIGALILRELLTRYGRHNIGLLWMFVEPMLFTIAIALLWFNLTGSEKFGVSIFAFALTGYSTVMLWRNMPTRCIPALDVNASLLYHRNVRLPDLYFSRILIEACGATLSFLILSTLFIWAGLAPFPADPGKVLVGWLMTAWFGAGLGIFIGTLSVRSELVEKFWQPTSYILFPLSGALFMVSALPVATQDVLMLLPMVHGVECIRDGFFGDNVRARYDLGYMATFNAVLFLLAMAQLRSVERIALEK